MNNIENVKLIKEINKLIENENMIKKCKEELYNYGLMNDDFINKVDNISIYVINRVDIIKNYLQTGPIGVSERKEIEYILNLLARVQGSSIKLINSLTTKPENESLVKFDFYFLSFDSVPIYQEHIDIYMKKLGFNN